MNVGSLFSGCGGLDLGLHHAGFELAWACESNPQARAVLSRHWPTVSVATDVREVDAGFPHVDVLAGGFPCQDVSHAGLRAGLALGTRSGLWFEFARAIRVLRPPVVIVENVSGLLTAGLGLVLSDLAEASYDVRGCCFRASDLFAPHGRERLFLVATDAGAASADAASARRGGREDARVDRGDARAHASGFLESERGRRERSRPEANAGAERWGAYGEAIMRWEKLTRPAPAPTDDRGRLSPEFVEWMLGFPDGWTEGLRRTRRLKMLGNAVQVQAAELVGLAAMNLLVAKQVTEGNAEPVDP